MRVLITGGAGFIGSRLAARLAGEGATVSILDNLSPQIHGDRAEFSPQLARIARCKRGDVRDRSAIQAAVLDQDAIVHLAAETGTGQSMYSVEHYERVNIGGTAILLDVLVNDRPASLKKLVVASSRAIYGEGMYRCDAHGAVFPKGRTAKDLSAGKFEVRCPQCDGSVTLAATPEDTPLNAASFYGLTKQVQEQMVLLFAPVLNVSGIALRFQNVYGPGQSLNNPYTGLLSVFSGLARQRAAINVFEDGEESRDFLHVEDAVTAAALCLKPHVEGTHVLNVGSGVATRIIDVAKAVTAHFDRQIPIRITGDFRVGDIRHNVADLSKIRELVGYEPSWAFEDGIKDFLLWVDSQPQQESSFERSMTELRERNLLSPKD